MLYKRICLCLFMYFVNMSMANPDHEIIWQSERGSARKLHSDDGTETPKVECSNIDTNDRDERRRWVALGCGKQQSATPSRGSKSSSKQSAEKKKGGMFGGLKFWRKK